MKILREPPIRIEAYLFAIAAAVVAWACSVGGIRHEVNRLRDVADRLETMTVSQINDQSTQIDVHPASGGVDVQALAEQALPHILRTQYPEREEH